MPLLIHITTLLGCYALGCVLPSYYAVKWQTGNDLRDLGSGTAGSTNAGRVLGRSAFIVLTLLDILKGWLAMQLAALAGLTWVWLAGAGLAVVAGHIWPAQLKWRGGKGLSTAYGVILFWSPLTALWMWAVFGLGLLAMRNKTLGMLQAFFSAPLIVYALGGRAVLVSIALFLILALLMAWTHRSNLRAALQRRAPSPAPSPPPA